MQKGNEIKLPERDVERRKVLGTMLNLPKAAWNRLSCEEMEDVAAKRGLVSIEETKKQPPQSAECGFGGCKESAVICNKHLGERITDMAERKFAEGRKEMLEEIQTKEAARAAARNYDGYGKIRSREEIAEGILKAASKWLSEQKKKKEVGKE